MARLDTTHEVELDLEAGRQGSPAPASPSTSTSANNNKPSQKNKQKRRTRVVGCCCRVACAALLAAALVAAVLGALYLALDPKLPRYTVHALNVTAFGMDDDMTARATFAASVRFENPNRASGCKRCGPARKPALPAPQKSPFGQCRWPAMLLRFEAGQPAKPSGR
jgi:hypothetical protein